MSHLLYLLRHAKSDWKKEAASDFERPLSKRGVADAPKMAAWLAKQANKPTAIVSSPALRAYQTALVFSRALDVQVKDINFDNRIYAASLETLMEIIRALPEQEKSVLLVGHNPGLDLLLQVLCKQAKPRTDGKLMTTCAIAKIALESQWRDISDKHCVLYSLSRPKEVL
ncbi:phosphohistidine phosphatase, SixA [Nitrosomonas marina]|uniref:Phosphohistidine phosphatase, SixA n=1 Tax=Nitrosomonas marina TaxID=917 RepID=A0A1I0CZJ2_9PROT|nr:histidine phosphatase family protein [Nitrosomonas marina]SET25313.1 phosphohistidine phosphatase, SixA [Nitrosomonas marina]